MPDHDQTQPKERGEAIVYDRVTGEVYWRDTDGARQLYILDPIYYDLIVTTCFKDDAEAVVTTIEPPIEYNPSTMECGEAANVDRWILWDKSKSVDR